MTHGHVESYGRVSLNSKMAMVVFLATLSIWTVTQRSTAESQA